MVLPLLLLKNDTGFQYHCQGRGKFIDVTLGELSKGKKGVAFVFF